MKNIEQRLKRIEEIVNADKLNFGSDKNQIKLLKVISDQELDELIETKDDQQLHKRFLQLRKKYRNEIKAYVLTPETIKYFETEYNKKIKEMHLENQL